MRPISKGHGGYISDEPWYPKLWKDFWDVRRKVLPVLGAAMSDEDEVVRQAAYNCLIHTASDQITSLIDEVVALLRQVPRTNEYQVAIWQVLQDTLRIQRKQLDEHKEIRDKIITLSDEIISDSYHDRLLLSLKADAFRFYRGQIDSANEWRSELEKTTQELAQEGYENPKALQVELSWIIALPYTFPSQQTSFIRHLAYLDTKHRWYSQILTHALENEQSYIISTYLHERYNAGDIKWSSGQTRDLLAKHHQTATFAYLNMLDTIDLTEAFKNVMMLLDEKRIEWRHLTSLDNWIARLALDSVQQALQEASLTNNVETNFVALSWLKVYLTQHPDRVDSLQDYAFTFLNRDFSHDSNIQGWLYWMEWRLVASLYVSTAPVEIVQIALARRENSILVPEDIFVVIQKALETKPIEVWDAIGQELLSDSMWQYSMIREDFREIRIEELVGVDTLMEWAKSHINGQLILAGLVKMNVVPFNPLARALLIEYGDEIASHLRASDMFMSLAFSITRQEADPIRNIVKQWLDDNAFEVRIFAEQLLRDIDRKIETSQSSI